jgi:acetolactate decarboxylase
MTTLYNANVRAAYVAGEDDGTRTIDQVVAHGGFGLGARDRNDGELIILGGRAYRTAYDGTTSLLPADATTPYATAMRFMPDGAIRVDDKLDSAGLAGWLAERIDLSNRCRRGPVGSHLSCLPAPR